MIVCPDIALPGKTQRVGFQVACRVFEKEAEGIT